MKLTVPSGGHLPSSSATSKPGKPGPTAGKPAAKPLVASSAPKVYVVLSGDGLSVIAQRLNVSLSALLTTNEMTVTTFIYPGMRLTVPKGGSLPTATTTPSVDQPTGSKPTSSTPGGTTTTVTIPSPAATPKVSAKLQPMMNFAMQQQGKPYRFNTSGPGTYDCSGLAMAAFAEIGISLPHFSGAQALLGTAIDWTKESIKPGDLVFLESSKGSGIVDHVGIAISATQWLHAPRTGDVVRTGNIPMYRVVAVRRLVTP
jgi:cell wall-associated NlpC family hydrolase